MSGDFADPGQVHGDHLTSLVERVTFYSPETAPKVQGMVLNRIAANPFVIITKAAEEPGVAFTTAQRV